MFSKKEKCPRCNEKISGKFSYCPSCGHALNTKGEDYGLLGKNDMVDPMKQFENQMFGGLGGKMFGKMLNSAMKMLEKEMQKNMNQQARPKTNFELYINGKRINPANIKVTKKEITPKVKKKTLHVPTFTQDSVNKFKTLPKKEPITNVRRLANKVIYEIDIPGVESIKDISIMKLENSIELKAIAKKAAYTKTITVDLPLQRYKLEDEKLILELGVKD